MRFTAGLLVVLVLTGCGRTSSAADLASEIGRAVPGCAETIFTAPGQLAPNEVAPSFLECDEAQSHVIAYHFSSAEDYETSRVAFDDPRVLSRYVVEGANWVVTTHDAPAAVRLAKALDEKLILLEQYKSPLDRNG